MARTNNLTNYLTDVASAIKTKKGDSTPILASNFDTEIENLPSGGVDPYDYFIGSGTGTGSPAIAQYIKKIPKIILTGYNSCAYLFSSFTRLEEVDISGLDTTNVTNFSYMFSGCMNLTKATTSNLSGEKVTTMQRMFGNCENLTEIDLSGIGTTVVSNLNALFYNCRRLKKVNLSNFKTTTSITSLSNAFQNCTQMQEIDMRSFDFSSFAGSTADANHFFGTGSTSGIPNDCLVIVKDDTQKELVTSSATRLTNVKTVAELEE